MQHLDWTATLNSMKESLPRSQFLNWIEPLEFIQSDETSVRLGVPSQFHEDMLRGHLKQHLIQAIQKQTGSPVQLEFEVLAKTNFEASQSTEPPATELPFPLPVPPPQRPSLRVIEGALSKAENESLVEPPPPARPQYPRFTNPFFEVPFNAVALQAARLFVEGKDSNLNSIVIIAGVGMGKTHLLSTIGESIEAKFPRLRIRYTNSESFTAEMVQSFRDNNNHEFKKRYREETDVLLFDDVHELQGRDRTQEQVLHIFNELLTLGRRIVFTSKVPISRLTRIIEPLRSRLQSMVAVEIENAIADDRFNLLTQVVEHNQIVVDGQALRHLSENGSQDVRELIGSIVRLHIKSKLENKPITADYLIRQGSFQQATRSQVTIDEIISLVEMNFGVSRQELSNKGRKSNIAWARQVAMYLARHLTYLPLEEIGAAFGRDHATVLYSYERVSEGVRTQRDIQLQIEYLLERLKSKAPKK